MKILVINAGSSSLKYQLIDMDDEKILAKGLVDRIGISGSSLEHKGKSDKLVVKKDIKNHTEALQLVLNALTDPQFGLISSMSEISAVGHRVLHSGEDFDRSVLLDEEKMKLCRKNSVLGPLHMPANVGCIEACQSIMPNTPMVAVFDTAFHMTMPKHAFMYAIPYEDYQKYKIRRYGFHGTSHKFVTGEALKYLKTDKCKIITLHLGNGSSLAAVVDGKVIDTSMGLTPLEGVVMGTRSGDIDPACIEFIMDQKGLTIHEALNYLNKKSGFLGIAGVSDFRELVALAESGDERANLAVDMFAYRIRKYIGAYTFAMGGLDALIFTGGIGENSYVGRERILKGLEFAGIEYDEKLNKNFERGTICEITKPNSRVKAIVIPTNEELVIARDTKELVEAPISFLNQNIMHK